MNLEAAFRRSEALYEALSSAIDLPLLDDSPRVKVSDVACSLSLEHWHSVRLLLEGSLLSSALVVHRAQFESLVRSIWLTYVASDDHVSKLTAVLDLDSEQAAKNVPQLNDMMAGVERQAPKEAFAALSRFKVNSWKALNSYAHAGLHPLRRHAEGYPLGLIHGVLCNANGLAVISCMQAVVLSGEQPLQRRLLDIAQTYPDCMPAPL